MVDIFNLFSVKDIFFFDESFVVICFWGIEDVDFFYYLCMIEGSFMLCINMFVVLGGKMGFVMELVLILLIKDIILKKCVFENLVLVDLLI